MQGHKGGNNPYEHLGFATPVKTSGLRTSSFMDGFVVNPFSAGAPAVVADFATCSEDDLTRPPPYSAPVTLGL